MQSSFYVGMSAQIAIDRRLQSIANNVANMNTAGFRAEGVSFATMLSDASADSTAYPTEGASFISRRGGDLTKTDNPLDVAVQGDAWFGIKTAQGVAYTRDGRMKINAGGELQTLNGNSVLDAGGSAMILDPDAGPPIISADGMMTQGGRQVGAIGLFAIDPSAQLTRTENSGVIPDQAAKPVLDFTSSGMAQGFVEGSNVNPVLELSKLISIQHALEHVTQMNDSSDTSLQDAIKTLGSTS